MRTVNLQRKKSFWGCAIVYMVFCDGKMVASVRNGQEVSFNVDESEHIIQCQATSPVYVSDGSGGGGTTVSDVVNIPASEESINLFVSHGFASLKLKVVS